MVNLKQHIDSIGHWLNFKNRQPGEEADSQRYQYHDQQDINSSSISRRRRDQQRIFSSPVANSSSSSSSSSRGRKHSGAVGCWNRSNVLSSSNYSSSRSNGSLASGGPRRAAPRSLSSRSSFTSLRLFTPSSRRGSGGGSSSNSSQTTALYFDIDEEEAPRLYREPYEIEPPFPPAPHRQPPPPPAPPPEDGRVGRGGVGGRGGQEGGSKLRRKTSSEIRRDSGLCLSPSSSSSEASLKNNNSSNKSTTTITTTTATTAASSSSAAATASGHGRTLTMRSSLRSIADAVLAEKKQQHREQQQRKALAEKPPARTATMQDFAWPPLPADAAVTIADEIRRDKKIRAASGDNRAATVIDLPRQTAASDSGAATTTTTAVAAAIKKQLRRQASHAGFNTRTSTATMRPLPAQGRRHTADESPRWMLPRLQIPASEAPRPVEVGGEGGEERRRQQQQRDRKHLEDALGLPANPHAAWVARSERALLRQPIVRAPPGRPGARLDEGPARRSRIVELNLDG